MTKYYQLHTFHVPTILLASKETTKVSRLLWNEGRWYLHYEWKWKAICNSRNECRSFSFRFVFFVYSTSNVNIFGMKSTIFYSNWFVVMITVKLVQSNQETIRNVSQSRIMQISAQSISIIHEWRTKYCIAEIFHCGDYNIRCARMNILFCEKILHNVFSIFQVKWYRETMLVVPNEYRYTEHFGIRHTLVLRKVQREDFGNYSCRAENSLGRSRAFIELSGN